MEGTFEEVNIDEQEMVYEEKMDVYKMDVDMDGTPIKLNSERSVVRLNYVYPSTDPFGDPITLSGTIVIPEDIWNGTHRSEASCSSTTTPFSIATRHPHGAMHSWRDCSWATT